MDKHEASKAIEKQLCYEVNLIAESIQKNSSISIQELEKLDKLYHTLKSKKTYEAMEDAEEYQNEERGPSKMYMNGNSYSDGFSHGYSEAMSHMHTHEGNSGHYPMPYYDRNPRW